MNVMELAKYARDHFDLQDFCEYEKNLRRSDYYLIGQGQFRRTFSKRNRNFVVKVPKSDEGLIDNIVESLAWHMYRGKPTFNGLILAPSRLMTNGCLLMTKVEPIQNYDKLPEWGFSIDNNQVGELHGKHVAYDYALEIPERILWEKKWDFHSSFYQYITKSVIHRTLLGVEED